MPGLYHNFPDHKRRTTVQLQHSGTLRALQNLRFSDFLGPDRQFLTEMHLKIANGSWCMITNAFFQRRPTNVACDPFWCKSVLPNAGRTHFLCPDTLTSNSKPKLSHPRSRPAFKTPRFRAMVKSSPRIHGRRAQKLKP